MPVAEDSCPTYDVVTDFNLEAYLGTWYQAAVNHEFQARFGGQCVNAEYAAIDAGTISVDNSSQQGEEGAFEARTHVTGTARLADPESDEARLLVSLTSVDSPYNVLKTDYTSYALVYSCTETSKGKVQAAYLLTREMNPVLEPLVDTATFEFAKVGVDFDTAFEFTTQGTAAGCSYD